MTKVEPLLGSGTVLRVPRGVGFAAELGERPESYDMAADPIEPTVVMLPVVLAVDSGGEAVGIGVALLVEVWLAVTLGLGLMFRVNVLKEVWLGDGVGVGVNCGVSVLPYTGVDVDFVENFEVTVGV